ncbi:MAG: hypothetical protein JWQ11_408 [Rhizobacter sp.]|nr:hypothetical protein [Rhizobacter sp.]
MRHFCRALSLTTLTLLQSATLAACGGGGDSLNVNAGVTTLAAARVGTMSGATAAGLWTGMTAGSSALHYTVAILPDGQSWSVYDRNGVPYGVVRADNGWNGSAVVATGDDYLVVAGTKSTSAFQATYASKAWIDSQLQGSADESLRLVYDTAFDTPADPASVVGTFKLSTLSPLGYSSGEVTTPDATGAFTGWVASCMFAGRSTPRADGTGIFDTTVTFAASGCSYDGQTLTGVSVLNTQNGVQTLTIAALLPDRSAGFAAIGVR